MQPHAKPDFDFTFDPATEIKRIRAHQRLPDRRIPARVAGNVLVATWNLTNFGLQKREPAHLRLMAEILRPFDVVAVQEIADDITHFNMLLAELGADWRAIYADIAGNDERLGYLYRADRVKSTGLHAELAMVGYENRRIVVEGFAEEFTGFNRNPYIVGFAAKGFEFALVNVHLYWSNLGVRRQETLALAKWAKSRAGKNFPPNNDIILIGDFNLPSLQPTDPIYSQLIGQGLQLPAHVTELVGSNLAGDAHYDELAFFPDRTREDFTGKMGVFDYDNAVFKELYDDSVSATKNAKFFQYVRYYIADHRPMWAEFKRR